jgi:two-component system nitrogen regulation response regulator NtrX
VFLRDNIQNINSNVKLLMNPYTSAEAVLMAQAWTGNARDLRNIMERLAVLVEEDRINGRMVRSVLQLPELPKKTTETLADAREAFERSYVLACLDENNWNIADAAQAMDIERTHLYRKMV